MHLAKSLLGVLAFLLLNACAPPEKQNVEAVANYAPQGWLAMSLPEISEALRNGEVSSEELTGAYLDRIAEIDRAGPSLHSVLAINPDALNDARARDADRKAGKALGPLHGVPILLKDNIESADAIATTAGALALMGNVTGRDSPLAANLRASGAVILGKTNLSQWANFRSNHSMSGWSALGGQVRNPHMLDRNPCGSSSGSAAAIAASLAAGAVGTETNGSIICPSAINGVVGLKPTVGLISQQYIVPISSSQDTAGPMTKTVKGAAIMLTAMAGEKAAGDYATMLDVNALSGVRVGVMRFAQGSNPDIVAHFDDAIAHLEALGAIIVEIDEFEPATENFWGKAYDVLKYEFNATLNAYLRDAPAPIPVRSLEELIAFNNDHAEQELSLFGQDIFEESVRLGGLDESAYLAARGDIQKATREDGIDALLAEHEVSVLVGPSGPITPRIDPINGDVWPEWAGAGYLAAIAGYPNLTAPMGAVHGLPVGLSFIAGRNEDGAVLSYGYAFEQRAKARIEPRYLKSAEAREEIARSMKGLIAE